MAISNAGFGGKWKFQEIHPPKQFLMSYFDKFKPQKLVWLSFIDCSNIIVYQSRTPHSRDVVCKQKNQVEFYFSELKFLSLFQIIRFG